MDCDAMTWRLASRTHGKPRDRGRDAMRVVLAPHQDDHTDSVGRGQIGNASCTDSMTPSDCPRGEVLRGTEATAGIEPAMKVLQASRLFFGSAREFLSRASGSGSPRD